MGRGSGGSAPASSGYRCSRLENCGRGCAGSMRASRFGPGSTPAGRRSRIACTAARRRCSAGVRRARDAAVALQGLRAHLLLGDRDRAGASAWAGEVPAGAGGHAGWRPEFVSGAGPAARGEPDDGLALADAHPRGAAGHRRERVRGHRRGGREVLSRVAQGLAGMGEACARSGALPKPDRPRWRDYRRLGLLRPAGTSKYRIPVLTVTDRAGARRADVLPTGAPKAWSPCSTPMSAAMPCSARTGTAPTTCSRGPGRCPTTACPRTDRGSSTPPSTSRPSITCTPLRELHEALLRPRHQIPSPLCRLVRRSPNRLPRRHRPKSGTASSQHDQHGRQTPPVFSCLPRNLSTARQARKGPFRAGGLPAAMGALEVCRKSVIGWAGDGRRG